MIAAPLSPPAVKAIDALPSPGVATRLVGAAGTETGVTLFDGADAVVCQVASVAVAVNV